MNRDFLKTEYYQNRELSWIQFEHRVLNESREEELPILERLKFVSITSSNLDEFFMVRVAAIKDMVHAHYRKKDFSGLTPKMQLQEVHQAAHVLVKEEYQIYNKTLSPVLQEKGIYIYHEYDALNQKQKEYVQKFFMENIYPVLTPMALDAHRPFPLVKNQSLNIAAMIQQKKKHSVIKPTEKSGMIFATVQVPEGLPRLILLPETKEGRKCFVLLEQVIEHNLSRLFLDFHVVCTCPYRVIRNADLSFDEDEVADLLKEIQRQLVRRQWGEVIRLEVEQGTDRRILRYLTEKLGVEKQEIYHVDGPIDLTFLMKLYAKEGMEELRQPLFLPQQNPRLQKGYDVFAEIRKGDIFLSHPYESFQPVVDFIRQAAEDENVLAIKQTLYRVGGNSPIVSALTKAAENGKQVTVLVELKARFDEENNIGWAKKLEKAGCHVIYGLVGLKTHCKIALVIRREKNGMVRYVHVGTGNYNDSTAKLYTDCGILTCRESFGEDATSLFNMLSGYAEPSSWKEFFVAPIWLRETFVSLINQEILHAREGKKACIIAKMNSLCDGTIIEKLYEASCAGVEIKLIVRGICCLRAGVSKVSENIQVSSIVGNFLEHSRIFYFYNDGSPKFYMGSADWMPRNMDRRIELLFPVKDLQIQKRLYHILQVLLQDNRKAYYMEADGEYRRKSVSDKKLGAQEQFCEEAMKAAFNQLPEKEERIFGDVGRKETDE